MGRGYLPPGHIHVVSGGGKGDPGEPGGPGPAGPPGPSPWRTPVPWAPDETYSALPPASVVTYDGETWLCADSHISGNNFDAARFVKLAAKAAAAPNPGTPILIRLNGAPVDSGAGDDTTPNAFSFTNVTNAALATVYVSSPITVSGINAPATISVTGGLYSRNGGPFTEFAGTVLNGDTVQLRVTSSPDNSTPAAAVLNIGGVTAMWTVTTTAVVPDTTPNPFVFTDVANATLGAQFTSNTIVVSGINASSPISISGGGTYSINGGAFTSTSATVLNGDQVTLRVTSSTQNNTSVNVTLTIGGVADTWTVTTVAVQTDTTPNQFTFTDQFDVATATVVFSNIVTVSGINAPAPIALSGDGAYSINGASFTTASGFVNNGDTVQLRVTSSASNSTNTNTILTIGGVADTWVVRSVAATTDTVPNQFVFTDVPSATQNTLYTSNIITVTGINAPAPLTLTSEALQAAYSKNGGAFTSAATTVVNGDTIQLRLFTETGAAGNTIVLNIGGVADTWNVIVPASTGGSTTVSMPTFEDGPWKCMFPASNAALTTMSGTAIELWPNDTNGKGVDLKNVDNQFLDRQTDGSIIFYAPLIGAKSSNTSYTRTELREILLNATNEYEWSLSTGGRLEATLKVLQLPTLTKGSTNRCVIGQIHGSSDELCRLYYHSTGQLIFIDDQAISGSGTAETSFPLTTDGTANGTRPNIPLGAEFTYIIEADNSQGCRVTAWYNGVKYWARSPKSSFWNSAGTVLYFKAGVYNAVGEVGSGKTNEGTGGSKTHFRRLLNPLHPHTITNTSGDATG